MYEVPKILFGRAVKARRLAIQISQEELAEKAALHRTYISDVERGMRNISLESMVKIAGALGMPLVNLFSEFPINRESMIQPCG